MAWIESHQSMRTNPKTRRAARALNISVVTMIGHLHMLWWWALDHAEDGDLTPYDPEDIADAAGWEGDADTFVDALTNCGPAGKVGYLEHDGTRGDPDNGDTGDLVIHDWWDYAGKLIARRTADRERKRRTRAAPTDKPLTSNNTDVRKTSNGRPPDNRRTSDDVTRPSVHTEPNRTEPNPTKSSRARARPLPDNWTPNDTHQRIAAEERINLNREALKFRDHAIANDRRQVDWDAAFRTWIRRSSDYGASRPAPSERPRGTVGGVVG